MDGFSYYADWRIIDDREAFCVTKPGPSSKFLYTDRHTANYIHNKVLDTPFLKEEDLGSNRPYFEASFDPFSGIGRALNISKERESDIINAIIKEKKDEASFSKIFTEQLYAPPHTAVFSENWPLSSEKYIEWAKYTRLDLEKAYESLDLTKTPNNVSHDLLDREKNARAALVAYFTGMKNLELFGEKLRDSGSDRNMCDVIGQSLIFALRPLTINWMRYKLEVRKLILGVKADTVSGRSLYRSTLWDPNVFPKEAFVKLKENANKPKVYRLLDLGPDGKPFRQQPKSNQSYQSGSKQSISSKDPDYRFFRGSSAKNSQGKSSYPSSKRSRSPPSQKSGGRSKSKAPFGSQQGSSGKGKQSAKGRRDKSNNPSK